MKKQTAPHNRNTSIAKSAEESPAKVKTDTARYEALAREHGADLSEDKFNETLRKVARHKPPDAAQVDRAETKKPGR